MPLLRLLALLCLLSPLAAHAEFPGRYVGIDAADGMRLELEAARGARLTGSLDLGFGDPIAFQAEEVDGVVEAALATADRAYFAQIIEDGPGVVARLTPVDREGRLYPEEASTFAFVPEGTPIPDLPTRFIPEPRGPIRTIEPRSFVVSYPLWSAQGAAWGYDAVPERYRTVIRLYPLVQADLLRKICRSPQRTRGIAEALDGQGVTCDDVTRALPESAPGSRFDAAVEGERRLLAQALACARKLLRRDPKCAEAGRETARRAASMETVRTVLARYR
jgi:hypothetical protein